MIEFVCWYINTLRQNPLIYEPIPDINCPSHRRANILTRGSLQNCAFGEGRGDEHVVAIGEEGEAEVVGEKGVALTDDDDKGAESAIGICAP